MISGCHCRDYVYSGLSISTLQSSSPLTLSLTCPTPRLSVVVTMCWSVPLGALSTLGTRGTTGILVVRVDAEPGLNHHHAVVMSVPAVFICERKTGRLAGR